MCIAERTSIKKKRGTCGMIELGNGDNKQTDNKTGAKRQVVSRAMVDKRVTGRVAREPRSCRERRYTARAEDRAYKTDSGQGSTLDG